MALSPEAREAARLRKRAQRDRDRRSIAPPLDLDDAPEDAGSSQLSPAGITQPTDSGPGPVSDLMTEQAIWVHRRRQLTEIEIRRRKGELIEIDEAKQQSAALARRVRSALARAPSLLPADLSPEVRAASVTAMDGAIRLALAAL
jgi:hypothetical protein